MNNLDPCPRCGLTTFEEVSGHIYCSNGHSQGPAIANEGDEDFGRRGKILRRKIPKARSRPLKVLRGRKAYRLFLKAWGWVLWRQCWGIVRVKGVGEELWEVVRGLWELRVGGLVGRFGEKNLDSLEEEGREVGRREGMEMESTDEDEEEETEGEEQAHQHQPGLKAARKASDSPTLVEVAAMNYLGVLILRYPLDIETFFSWLQTETIPFIRAIRHVPPEIKDRLPGHYHSALDTLHPLQPSELQHAISQLSTLYSDAFGVTIPPLNQPPILLSYIETLALPLQIYPMVKHLNTILNFSFAYPSHPTRMTAVSYPSVQIMTLIIIATKLLFPFDAGTLKRYPYSLSSPGVLRMDWDIWLEAKHAYDNALSSSLSDSSPIKPGTELGLKDTDILSMTDTELDAYMTWYQRMWTSPDRKKEGIQARILDMFPLKPLTEPSTESVVEKEKEHDNLRKNLRVERVRRVQSSLKTRRAVSEEEEMAMLESGELEREILRPGMLYSICSSVEELEGVARVFFEEAAETACIGIEALVRAVRSAEDRIEKWRRERRREAVFGKEGEGGGGEEMEVEIEGEEVVA